MNVAYFVFEQQADTADNEIQNNKLQQTPGKIFAAVLGLDDKENAFEQKRQIGGNQRDEKQDSDVQVQRKRLNLG